MGKVLLRFLSAAGLVGGLVAVVFLVATAIVNPDAGQRVAAVTAAAIRQRGDHGGRQYVEVVVANIGRGPALHAGVSYHEFPGEAVGHLFGSSPLFDLGPGESESFSIYLDAGAEAQAFRRVTDDLPDPAVAVGFEDIVGNRYRCASGRGFRREPDTWRRGDANQPDWARWK